MLIDGYEYGIQWSYTSVWQPSFEIIFLDGETTKSVDRGTTYDRHSSDVVFVGTYDEMEALEEYLKDNLTFTAVLSASEQLWGADTEAGSYSVSVSEIGQIVREVKLYTISCRINLVGQPTYKTVSGSLDVLVPLNYTSGALPSRVAYRAWDGSAYGYQRDYADGVYRASFRLPRGDAEKFRKAIRSARGNSLTLPSGFDWFGSLGGTSAVVTSFNELRESYSTWIFSVEFRRV